MTGRTVPSLRLAARPTVTVFALTLVVLLGSVAHADAAPHATDCRFTNPIAYELKSFLYTRAYFKVDTPGSWARLDILGANGIVKTMYDGPVWQANTYVWTPIWNGLDVRGRRLPSGSYDWRLTVSKGSQSSVTRGKITISKIYFNLSGQLLRDQYVTASRYMVDGAATFYVWANTPGSINSWMILSCGAKQRVGGEVVPYPHEVLTVPANRTATYPLRYPGFVPTRGMREVTIVNNIPGNWEVPTLTSYYVTVIQ